MRTTIIGILTLGAIAIVAVAPGSNVFAQQPACLHQAGESADQLARRQQALRMARVINSVQATARAVSGAYQPLTNLPGGAPASPQGFVAHLAVDPNGYAFSIKDSTDPCGFAYFSDQDGVIFAGEFIR